MPFCICKDVSRNIPMAVASVSPIGMFDSASVVIALCTVGKCCASYYKMITLKLSLPRRPRKSSWAMLMARFHAPDHSHLIGHLGGMPQLNHPISMHASDRQP